MNISGRILNNLRYSDDTVLPAGNEKVVHYDSDANVERATNHHIETHIHVQL